jgi:hypothetical protein
MICPSCSAPGAVLVDGKTLTCPQCHAKEFAPDPNKVCPKCHSQLRTSASIHAGGFRVARRACRSKTCRYSVVLASFVVSTRDGQPGQGPGYVKVAQAIQDGKLRMVWDE